MIRPGKICLSVLAFEECCGNPISASLKHFDSQWVTLSRNSDACLFLDLPSPSRGKPVRRGGRRRLLSALSFSICMSHPAAAPGTVCNAHTTPRSTNTRALHAQVVMRRRSLPLTRTEPACRFILGRTGIVLRLRLAQANKRQKCPAAPSKQTAQDSVNFCICRAVSRTLLHIFPTRHHWSGPCIGNWFCTKESNPSENVNG